MMVLSYAGGIGLNGINNRGLGVCVNTLLQLNPCREGLPVACVMRAALESVDATEAVDKLRCVRHAAGQNYLIGDRTVVRDLECSANQTVELSAAGIQVHTNHPLANTDFTVEYRATATGTQSDIGRKMTNSMARYDSLWSRSSAAAPHDLTTVKAALAAKDSSEHPVCRARSEPWLNCTFASTVMVLGEKPEFHVAPGPPDVTPYQVFAFN
jgi:predicted choloylglycine hydrolase